MSSPARPKELLKEFHLFALLKLVYNKHYCSLPFHEPLAPLSPREAVRMAETTSSEGGYLSHIDL